LTGPLFRHGREGGTRIALVQTTVPDYRQPFLELLEARLPDPLQVLAGREYFDPTVSLAVDHGRVTLVSNHFLLGRRLLWQRGVLGRALGAKLVIVELNPRVLSTWAILIVRRSLRRPVLLWGHAWPRGGAHARSDRVRQLMRRLASAVIVYSETQAADLGGRMPGKRVVAAPNALYSAAAQPEVGSSDATSAIDFVFVGRLVPAKKPKLLLDAFVRALDDLPVDTRLVFVGEGPLRPELERRAESAARARVAFLGARSELAELEPVYARALASVIPGYAGLSLIQSLWFGAPSIIADDEPHSPEIEAAQEGWNCVFFASDSAVSLSDALVSVARNRDEWRKRRAQIARQCAEAYSLEAMVEAFARTIREVAA
jgi:glycosyltransferase involved in cell wall biosynthesis